MQDEDIAAHIMRLLAARATLCPSEVARDIAQHDWRPLMPAIRKVAGDMAKAETIEITQRGAVLDPDRPIRGPIRLRLREQN